MEIKNIIHMCLAYLKCEIYFDRITVVELLGNCFALSGIQFDKSTCPTIHLLSNFDINDVGIVRIQVVFDLHELKFENMTFCFFAWINLGLC